MQRREFDRFADEYTSVHARNIRVSGEDPGFFARYKVRDLKRLALATGASRPNEAPIILDFGGGVGNSTPHLQQEFPDGLILNTDVSLKSLSIARTRFPEAHQVAFEGHRLPFNSDSIDLVLCSCVFHHIPHNDHSRIIAEIRRTMKSGGLIVIYEHNPFNPITVRTVNTCPFDENAELIRAEKLREVVAHTGFESPRIEYRVFFPAFARALRPLEAYLTSLPIGAQYLVYATK